jgi:hypothetical protein
LSKWVDESVVLMSDSLSCFVTTDLIRPYSSAVMPVMTFIVLDVSAVELEPSLNSVSPLYSVLRPIVTVGLLASVDDVPLTIEMPVPAIM